MDWFERFKRMNTDERRFRSHDGWQRSATFIICDKNSCRCLASVASEWKQESNATSNPIITPVEKPQHFELLQPYDPQRAECPLMLKIKILFPRETLRLLCISNLAFLWGFMLDSLARQKSSRTYKKVRRADLMTMGTVKNEFFLHVSHHLRILWLQSGAYCKMNNIWRRWSKWRRFGGWSHCLDMRSVPASKSFRTPKRSQIRDQQ